jgi:hypothetical protein
MAASSGPGFRPASCTGRGAVLIYADSYEDYAEAMTAKLLRELEPPLVAELLLSRGGA